MWRRGWLAWIVREYFILGSIFGVILWGACSVNQWRAAPRDWPTGQRVRWVLGAQPMFLAFATIRLVWWGPSLVLWTVGSDEYSLFEWLGPGLTGKIEGAVSDQGQNGSPEIPKPKWF
jgi:hypothetical protein